MGLDIVELIIAIEDEFDLKIPNEDAERLRTVGDIYWYVREHAQESSDTASRVIARERESDPLMDRVLDVIEHNTGVRRSSLVPDASLVNDLGLD